MTCPALGARPASPAPILDRFAFDNPVLSHITVGLGYDATIAGGLSVMHGCGQVEGVIVDTRYQASLPGVLSKSPSTSQNISR